MKRSLFSLLTFCMADLILVTRAETFDCFATKYPFIIGIRVN